MTRTRRAQALGAALFAALGLTARPAHAQKATYFPADATINYATPGDGYVGFDQSLNPSSPTVNLVTGGLIDGDLQVYNASTFNVSGGSVADILQAFGSSAVNVSGGTVGTYLEADSSSTVTVSGGAVGQSGSVDFYDNTVGAYTFVGVGLSYALDPGGPTFGPGADYTLSGRLQGGQSVTGDIVDVASGKAMFTFAPEPPAFAGLALGALSLAGLALKACKRRA